jgi:predicted nucleic-acid-binding Zn-ribbon protein
MTTEKYACAKCKHTEHKVGQIKASGGALASIFDLENKTFTTITCINCGYTDFFARPKGDVVQMIADGVLFS